jgi:hypothetical protein
MAQGFPLLHRNIACYGARLSGKTPSPTDSNVSRLQAPALILREILGFRQVKAFPELQNAAPEDAVSPSSMCWPRIPLLSFVLNSRKDLP